MPSYFRLCPAKINLHLRIGQKFCEQNRVYHRVLTLLQGVLLRSDELGAAGDFLRLSLSEERGSEIPRLAVQAVPAPCAEQDNLVYRAAQLYVEHLHCSHDSYGSETLLWPRRIVFELKKYIPERAGLAGGSSDAAAALLLLNEALPAYMGVKPLAQLQELAAHLGTDIAFFLEDFSSVSVASASASMAWGMARGEKIVALMPSSQNILHNVLGAFQLWLIKPQDVHCPTGIMYQLLDREFGAIEQIPIQAQNRIGEQVLEIAELEQQIEQIEHQYAGPQEKIAALSKLFCNDFFECLSAAAVAVAGVEELPVGGVNRVEENVLGEAGECLGLKEGFLVLASLYDYLYSLAASWVALSGSGSAFFAFFPADLSEAEIRKGLESFAVPLEFYAAQIY